MTLFVDELISKLTYELLQVKFSTGSCGYLSVLSLRVVPKVDLTKGRRCYQSTKSGIDNLGNIDFIYVFVYFVDNFVKQNLRSVRCVFLSICTVSA